MFSTYLKTALRNLSRNKAFAFINIAGLGVGICVCLVIFAILKFELSYDKFHTRKDRIYRVISDRFDGEGMRKSPGAPYAMPTALNTDLPSLTASPVMEETNAQIIIPDEKGSTIKKFREDNGVFFVKPSFFEIFDYPLLAGDYQSLKEPNTALLSQSTADRYFGDWKTAIGKTFKKNKSEIFTVTGIIKDMPDNTDIRANILASYATQKWLTSSTDWHSTASNHNCYLLLPKGTSADQMAAQLTGMLAKYYQEKDARDGQTLQALEDVHYNEAIRNFTGRTISPQLINTLWMIAAFILLIACVNFVNLSTAQAFNRSKEVGVRKVLGGSRRQIRIQFYGETLLMTLLAMVFALMLAGVAIPFIATLLHLPLTVKTLLHPSVLLVLSGILLVVVLIAGFYPAIVISRFNPITALKSKLAARATNGISLRRGLVVFQFLIAQVLIIGMLIIVKQMSYFRNQSMGFDKEAIVNLTIPSDSTAQSKIDFVRTKVRSIAGVKDISFSFASPADNGNWSSSIKFDHSPEETSWFANLKWADADYANTYGLDLVAGRNVHPSDTVAEFLVNETLLKQLGITDPQQALNKEIVIWDEMKGSIVGVVKDFNALSLRSAVVPVLISTNKRHYRKAGIKLATGDLTGTLVQLRNLWNRTFPDFVFDEQFLDAKVANFYAQENRLANLYKIFAALAVFLSCLGLYGLASFMAVQRVKEVGIRKVLGASAWGIIYLFSKEFLLLIGIAFAVAVPLAWYFMNGWLNDFAYRIDISWEIILISGLLAITVALLTISLKAVKAALANPVKSLRSE